MTGTGCLFGCEVGNRFCPNPNFATPCHFLRLSRALNVLHLGSKAVGLPLRQCAEKPQNTSTCRPTNFSHATPSHTSTHLQPRPPFFWLVGPFFAALFGTTCKMREAYVLRRTQVQHLGQLDREDLRKACHARTVTRKMLTQTTCVMRAPGGDDNWASRRPILRRPNF